MSELRAAFEEYAKEHPDVQKAPEVLIFADGKYTNEVIELNWQTWQACAAWHVAEIEIHLMEMRLSKQDMKNLEQLQATLD